MEVETGQGCIISLVARWWWLSCSRPRPILRTEADCDQLAAVPEGPLNGERVCARLCVGADVCLHICVSA